MSLTKHLNFLGLLNFSPLFNFFFIVILFKKSKVIQQHYYPLGYPQSFDLLYVAAFFLSLFSVISTGPGLTLTFSPPVQWISSSTYGT